MLSEQPAKKTRDMQVRKTKLGARSWAPVCKSFAIFLGINLTILPSLTKYLSKGTAAAAIACEKHVSHALLQLTGLDIGGLDLELLGSLGLWGLGRLGIELTSDTSNEFWHEPLRSLGEHSISRDPT